MPISFIDALLATICVMAFAAAICLPVVVAFEALERALELRRIRRDIRKLIG